MIYTTANTTRHGRCRALSAQARAPITGGLGLSSIRHGLAAFVALTVGAEWQPGVTADADRFKVLLNGEPLHQAVAASATDGWVDVLPEPSLVPVPAGRHAPLGLGYRIDPMKERVRRTGRVEIIPLAGRAR